MLTYKTNRLKKSPQTGMTLIEVMVALFILSTGILGAVAMQASAKKGSFDAMQRSMASSFSQNIIERMRSNNSTVGLNVLDGYNGTFGITPLAVPAIRCNTPVTLCNNAQLVINDLFEWEQSLIGQDVQNSTVSNGGLLGAVGCINHVNNVVTIVISWEGREETSDGAADNAAFGVSCGSSSDQRRQILVNAFIY